MSLVSTCGGLMAARSAVTPGSVKQGHRLVAATAHKDTGTGDQAAGSRSLACWCIENRVSARYSSLPSLSPSKQRFSLVGAVGFEPTLDGF